MRFAVGSLRIEYGRTLLLVSSAVILAMAILAPRNAAAEGELPPEFVGLLKAELHDRQFSGVLDVRAGDRTLWRHVSGAAASESSVFWIGSVSKQFAAAAALRLVDQGLLSLERPIADELGMGGSALSSGGVPCTLVDVLNHTCGLPSGNVCSFERLDAARVQEKFLRCVADLELDSKPGTAFAYSNVGYDLVGVLISRAAGMPYEEVLRREFFVPLGMDSTGVDLRRHPNASQRLVQGEAFNGFGWSKTWPWLLLDPAGPGTFGASGNIYSTAEDIHTWNRALHGGRLLPPALYRVLTTPGLSGYGLGVVIGESEDGTQWIWHNGSLTPMGWSSFVAYIPSQGVSVVGLANRSRHTSHVMAAGRSLVLAALNESVGPPILKDPTEADLAIEIFFYIVPIVVGCSMMWLGWALVRGPRRGALRWYGTLLSRGALYLIAVSLFDFFDRAATMSPALLVVVSLGMVFHEKKLEWPTHQNWAEGGKLRILSQLIAVILLGFLLPPTARYWFGALLLSQGLLLYLLLARRTGVPVRKNTGIDDSLEARESKSR